MPTGYTHDLYEGKEITFQDFVLQCARAFGALVTMRDDSMDTPIPERFEPSNWHLQEIKKTEQRILDIKTWDDKKAFAESRKEYRRKCKYQTEASKKRHELKNRYGKMLEQVENWNPPAPDHKGLKEFMIEQLKGSIDFDCSIFPMETPVLLLGQEYKQQLINKAQKDISYHSKANEEEVERVNKRNEWLKALRDSLTIGDKE